MKRILPFPTPDEVTWDLNLPQQDYLPFPTSRLSGWLEQLLEHLRVEVLSVIRWKTTSGWMIRPRQLPFDVFHYFLRGRGKIQVADRETEVSAGDCAHFRRGIVHSATTDSRDPLDLISLRYGATVFESLTLADVLGFPDVFPIAGDREAEFILKEACREYLLRPPGFGQGLEALIVRFLLHAIRQHQNALELTSSPARLPDLRRLLPALRSMRENLAEPDPMPVLARRAGLSAPQFRRVFQRALGLSPMQHLRRIRMEQACVLLRHTDKTIEAISAAIGYNQPAFFATSFKKQIGVTPGRYRSSHEM